MQVTIELLAGNRREPKAEDIQKNIDALTRMYNNEKPQPHDWVLTLDTLSILEGLKREVEKVWKND